MRSLTKGPRHCPPYLGDKRNSPVFCLKPDDGNALAHISSENERLESNEAMDVDLSIDEGNPYQVLIVLERPDVQLEAKDWVISKYFMRTYLIKQVWGECTHDLLATNRIQ